MYFKNPCLPQPSTIKLNDLGVKVVAIPQEPLHRRNGAGDVGFMQQDYDVRYGRDVPGDPLTGGNLFTSIQVQSPQIQQACHGARLCNIVEV